MVTDLALFNSIQPPQTRIFKLPYIDTCNFSLAFPDSAAMTDLKRGSNKDDPFLSQYQPSELRITSEFLTTWLPFLSRDLCHHCSQILSHRIRSLHSELDGEAENLESNTRVVTSSSLNEAETRECCYGNFHKNSSGSAKDEDDDDDTNSLGSWKDSANEWSEPISEVSGSGILGPSPHLEAAPSSRLSWADMAQEDELVEEEEQQDSIKQVVSVGALHGELRISDVVEKPQLSREERERIRFMNVRRKKDYLCFERINGKLVNIVEGLELHMGIFSAAEQKRIVDYVNKIEEMGKKGKLKARTYTAPRKWMKGKGRVTIQFGCCYNYATDKNGNPPGILLNETVDPIPPLFKVIIRRLVGWHVLPPTCVPDSCIVNIYDEGDCIPPHIDNHDFLRPFCTVSFVSECNILFGSDLKAVDAGLFTGSFSISLPVGSVLVLNGNGADVAKHCVPSVPTKRISITFRKMDETKQPNGFVPEPDLQGIKPLPYEDDRMKRLNPRKSEPHMERPMVKENNRRGYAEGHSKTESRYSNWNRRGAANKRGPM